MLGPRAWLPASDLPSEPAHAGLSFAADASRRYFVTASEEGVLTIYDASRRTVRARFRFDRIGEGEEAAWTYAPTMSRDASFVWLREENWSQAPPSLVLNESGAHRFLATDADEDPEMAEDAETGGNADLDVFWILEDRVLTLRDRAGNVRCRATIADPGLTHAFMPPSGRSVFLTRAEAGQSRRATAWLRAARRRTDVRDDGRRRARRPLPRLASGRRAGLAPP